MEFKIFIYVDAKGDTVYQVTDPENWRKIFKTLAEASEYIAETSKLFSYVLEK